MRIVPTFFGRHDIVLAISEHCGLSCALGNANNYSAISTARSEYGGGCDLIFFLFFIFTYPKRRQFFYAQFLQTNYE